MDKITHLYQQWKAGNPPQTKRTYPYFL